jgi:hypothetical protein
LVLCHVQLSLVHTQPEIPPTDSLPRLRLPIPPDRVQHVHQRNVSPRNNHVSLDPGHY